MTELTDHYIKAEAKSRRHEPCDTCAVETGRPVCETCFNCIWFWYEKEEK